MIKTVIFGNSGSGKSTLAKKLSASKKVVHLDLDTIAWQQTTPPQRTCVTESNAMINDFIMCNKHWVIEGCYADLLEYAMSRADNIVFLNLPIELCIINAKNRPWEPHKYDTKEAQDNNLDMLISWISEYSVRKDHFSQVAHLELFNQFSGEKEMRSTNE